MLLSHRTSLKICPEYSNIIGHMCYAASKLWNVCNYERHHYKELGLEKISMLCPTACRSPALSVMAAVCTTDPLYVLFSDNTSHKHADGDPA